MPERAAGAAVSVIIPVFDNEAYLGEAIESVLGQSMPPGEVVVVDDGSTDGSAAIAEAFGGKVRVVRQANMGISGARNRGVAETSGSLLAFLDADDRWLPRRLEVQLDALKADPGLELLFGAVAQVRAEDWAATVSGREPVDVVIPGTLCSTILVTRAAFTQVGGFDVRWRAGEFIDWFARARDAGVHTLGLPQVLVWRRIHSKNHGIRQRAAYRDYLGVVKASLDRRREAASRDGTSEA
ncbi:glycosyltransferase family A protein [soil metagenome]